MILLIPYLLYSFVFFDWLEVIFSIPKLKKIFKIWGGSQTLFWGSQICRENHAYTYVSNEITDQKITYFCIYCLSYFSIKTSTAIRMDRCMPWAVMCRGQKPNWCFRDASWHSKGDTYPFVRSNNVTEDPCGSGKWMSSYRWWTSSAHTIKTTLVLLYTSARSLRYSTSAHRTCCTPKLRWACSDWIARCTVLRTRPSRGSGRRAPCLRRNMNCF